MAKRKSKKFAKVRRPKRGHEGDDSEPMEEFDVPDICLGGLSK